MIVPDALVFANSRILLSLRLSATFTRKLLNVGAIDLEHAVTEEWILRCLCDVYSEIRRVISSSAARALLFTRNNAAMKSLQTWHVSESAATTLQSDARRNDQYAAATTDRPIAITTAPRCRRYGRRTCDPGPLLLRRRRRGQKISTSTHILISLDAGRSDDWQ